MKKSKLLFLLFVGLLLAAGWIISCREPRIAPGEVTQVQMNAVKIDTKRLGEKKVEALQNDITNVMNRENRVLFGAHKGETYFSLLLRTEEMKEQYFFFQTDDSWYMETKKGKVYEHAEFILDYADIDAKEETSAVRITMGETDLPVQTCIETGKKTDYDLRYEYYVLAEQEIASGKTKKEAEEYAQDILCYEWKQTAYAKKHKLAESKETYEKNYLKSFDRELYQGVLKQFAEYQIEETDAIQYLAKNTYVPYVKKALYQEAYEAFCGGEDEIEGTVYQTMTEYYNAWLLQVVYPESEHYDRTEFEKELLAAKAYYDKEAEMNK